MNPETNRLLASLPREVYEQLSPHFEFVDLPLATQLHDSSQPIRYIYFPISGIVSLLLLLEDGRTGEIAVVGREGVVGITLFMTGVSPPTLQVMVQAPGIAVRIGAEQALQVFRSSEPFRKLLLGYTQSLMMQVAQTALCNRHHSLEQQFARWLLLSLDRLDGTEVVMTQEMIANMLGVRREGVSSAARRLQEKRLIAYRRGQIQVLDRDKLERHACECYRAVSTE